jgi:hypothetical protein
VTRGTLLAAALACVLLAGCVGGLDTGEGTPNATGAASATAEPTETPGAPTVRTPTTTTAGPTATDDGDPLADATPVEATRDLGPERCGDGSYPPTDRETLFTFSAAPTSPVEAEGSVELYAQGVLGRGEFDLAVSSERPARVRFAGETVAVRERYGVERYYVATAEAGGEVGDRREVAYLVLVDGETTEVVAFSVTGDC